MLTNLSVLKNLAEELLKAKPLDYSEELISYYIDDSKFSIQNIHNLTNHHGHRIKATLITHKTILEGTDTELREEEIYTRQSVINGKCIIYLHGLGSSRMEALSLLEHLPKEYSLFTFDFSGSGKSEGQMVTYGLHESEDISAIIDYLRIHNGIKQFILWGRSMGAVAAILYANQLEGKGENKDNGEDVRSKLQKNKICGLVIDSPFANFKEICKSIGMKKVNIPGVFIDVAVELFEGIVEGYMKQEQIDEKYNPFSIKLDTLKMNPQIPTIFLYSTTDEIVPSEHSEKIIKNYKSLFEKIIMENCTHNQARPKEIVERVFEILAKMQEKEKGSKSEREKRRIFSLGESKNGRRGISVESKEKDFGRKSRITENSEEIKILYSSLKVEQPRQNISHRVSKPVSTLHKNRTQNVSPLRIRITNDQNSQNSSIFSTITNDTSFLYKKLSQASNSHHHNSTHIKNNLNNSFNKGSNNSLNNSCCQNTKKGNLADKSDQTEMIFRNVDTRSYIKSKKYGKGNCGLNNKRYL